MNRTLLTILCAVLLITSVFAQGRQRAHQPVPTYTFEVHGKDADDFSVQIEGTYTDAAGNVTEIPLHTSILPAKLYVNADSKVFVKVSTTEKPFIVSAYFEFNDTSQGLACASGNSEVPVTFKFPPRKE